MKTDFFCLRKRLCLFFIYMVIYLTLVCVCLCDVFVTESSPDEGGNKPNIVLLLADDYGWANLGVHRDGDEEGEKEAYTPNLNSLIGGGILLERHYAYKICSPSRSSLQSGRLAVHVNLENTSPTAWNKSDPVSGYAGIPRNMTGIAEKMRTGGYSTAMVGKWDAGMATPDHTPSGRGFEKWYGYYQHANNYWTKGVDFESTGEFDICLNAFTDISEANETYRGGVLAANEVDASCADSNADDPFCYEEHLFKIKGLEMIENHDFDKKPLFYFHSFHLLHTPLLVPKSYLKAAENRVKPKSYDDENRKKYSAMVHYMDDVVGELVQKFKEKGVWDNTLVVFVSDNGGPIYVPASANNYPLKGGKYSDWEGGIRTNAFVSGGYIPKGNRGTKYSGLISIADWYGMFAEFAQVDVHDDAAESANGWLREKRLPLLHPVDSSVNLWQKLTRNQTNREILHVSEKAVIKFPYKLVVGPQPYSGWTGKFYPNCTNNDKPGHKPFFVDVKLFDRGINASSDPSKVDAMIWVEDCGSTGCLFNILKDPNEHNDLLKSRDAHNLKGIHEEMVKLLADLNKNVFRPSRGELSVVACKASINNGGYYGPFVDADDFYTGPFQKESFKKKLKNAALLETFEALSMKSVQDAVVLAARNSFPLVADEMIKKMDMCANLPNYPKFLPEDFGLSMEILGHPIDADTSVVA